MKVEKGKMWITGIWIKWKDAAKTEEFLTFPGAEDIGIHTKHFVGDKSDRNGISLRRNDTGEEFAFLPHGTWSDFKIEWSKDV